MHNMQLSISVGVYNRLREQLMAEHGLAADDPALKDTLEGATDLQDLLVRLAREAKLAKAMADGCNKPIDDIEARQKRLYDKDKRIRQTILNAMQDAGLSNITSPDLTVFTRKGTATVTYADGVKADDVEDKWRKSKVIYSFHTDAIKAALNEGIGLPFATLSNGAPSLTIGGK